MDVGHIMIRHRRKKKDHIHESASEDSCLPWPSAVSCASALWPTLTAPSLLPWWASASSWPKTPTDPVNQLEGKTWMGSDKIKHLVLTYCKTPIYCPSVLYFLANPPLLSTPSFSFRLLSPLHLESFNSIHGASEYGILSLTLTCIWWTRYRSHWLSRSHLGSVRQRCRPISTRCACYHLLSLFPILFSASHQSTRE